MILLRLLTFCWRYSASGVVFVDFEEIKSFYLLDLHLSKIRSAILLEVIL
jgi:hypothetical protein